MDVQEREVNWGNVQLGSKRATVKIPLSVFPFGDICVYYITVYKQKIPRGTPRGTLVGASFLPKGISDSHENSFSRSDE